MGTDLTAGKKLEARRLSLFISISSHHFAHFTHQNSPTDWFSYCFWKFNLILKCTLQFRKWQNDNVVTLPNLSSSPEVVRRWQNHQLTGLLKMIHAYSVICASAFLMLLCSSLNLTLFLSHRL